MNKPIGLRIADIYLRFPEIMEEECNDLEDFLEQEHIVYEGATDIFIEKDKKIERLQNIIDELEKYINKTKLEEFEKAYGKRYGKTFTQVEVIICNMILNKLKDLKEGNKDE